MRVTKFWTWKMCVFHNDFTHTAFTVKTFWIIPSCRNAYEKKRRCKDDRTLLLVEEKWCYDATLTFKLPGSISSTKTFRSSPQKVLKICNAMSYLLQSCNTFLISSSVCISGDSPPWTQRNCWFMMAARGRQSKASMQASYTRSVYLKISQNQIKLSPRVWTTESAVFFRFWAPNLDKSEGYFWGSYSGLFSQIFLLSSM